MRPSRARIVEPTYALPRGFLTRAERRRLRPLYATESQAIADHLCVVKWFSADTAWYGVEIGGSEGHEVCFGLVVSPSVPAGELGCWSLAELADATVRLRVRLVEVGEDGARRPERRLLSPPIAAVERDRWFAPMTVGQIRAHLAAHGHRP